MAWQAKARFSLGPCFEQYGNKSVMFMSNANAAMGGTVYVENFAKLTFEFFKFNAF